MPLPADIAERGLWLTGDPSLFLWFLAWIKNLYLRSITPHIDAIIDKANVLSRASQYDEDIALLWACPNSTAIHVKVYDALKKIYLAKEEHHCSMLMKQAESAYALKNYDEMKRILDSIAATVDVPTLLRNTQERPELRSAMKRRKHSPAKNGHSNVPTLRKSTTASESTNSRSKKLPLFPA